MAILRISNRTENWKTARHFGPLFGHNAVRLARRLLPGVAVEPGDVRMELFWVGLRDYFHQEGRQLKKDSAELARAYSALFPGLGGEIEAFKGFRELRKDYHYVSKPETQEKLASNLFNTEIDIVLESPSHLFIGEAKHESPIGANGKDVLVHQLIRQYVMATILLHLREEKRTVVPFVVGSNPVELRKTSQVNFMLQGRMREENVLEWSDIMALW